MSLITEVLKDHTEIKKLFALVEGSQGHARRDAFQQLLNKLAIHETAEEIVVHPLARKTSGGEQVVEQRLAEEHKAAKVLSRLQDMDVESPEFDAVLLNLKKDVLAHAESEEQKEHPKIQQAVSAERLDKLGSVYRTAEAAAPAEAGSVPIESLIDTTRDAMREALKKA